MPVAPNDFTHLHVHSEFSLLDGLGRITELVDEAKTPGLRLAGASPTTARSTARWPSTRPAKAAEIKPIIGVETYVARRSMTDREGKADAQPYHLILLAKDWAGYQNLCRIVTDAHLDGYYYKPRIDRDYLAAALRGPGRAVGLPQRGGRAGHRDGRPRRGEAHRRLVPRHPRRRATSSSSCRTTACRSSASSTSSCCGWRRRWASRSSPPTTCTTSGARRPRRTTCCCASARRPTSTRRAG